MKWYLRTMETTIILFAVLPQVLMLLAHAYVHA